MAARLSLRMVVIDVKYRLLLSIPVLVTITLLGCGRQPDSSQSSVGSQARDEGTAVAVKDNAPSAPAKASAVGSHLKWSRAIYEKVQSPDGKTWTVWDSTGVYLTDPSGKHATKLPIRCESSVGNEHFSMSAKYNRQSTRLAVFTTFSGGEPGICENDRLYWVDTKSRRTQQIGQWDECIQGNGEAVLNRELLGWSADGKSIEMQAEVWQAEGMPAADGATSKSMRRVSFDVTRPKTWNRDALASQLF